MPKAPETLVAARCVMTFAGDLCYAGDLLWAVAINCDVTAGVPPQPGDFLSILDCSPSDPIQW